MSFAHGGPTLGTIYMAALGLAVQRREPTISQHERTKISVGITPPFSLKGQKHD